MSSPIFALSFHTPFSQIQTGAAVPLRKKHQFSPQFGGGFFRVESPLLRSLFVDLNIR
jgi:hypothetical protein